MDKVFEALERLAMPDDIHIKECEKLGIGVTEDYDTVEKALLELKSIKEANISEALKCLESIKDALWDDDFHYQRHSKLLDTIEQALLKAQEPKHYLKWEDLEWEELKTIVKKEIKVKLNGVEYGLEFTINYGIKEVVIFDKKNVLYAVFNECHKQFFNNLHLEVVGNE